MGKLALDQPRRPPTNSTLKVQRLRSKNQSGIKLRRLLIAMAIIMIIDTTVPY